jgi:hypothetical protein
MLIFDFIVLLYRLGSKQAARSNLTSVIKIRASEDDIGDKGHGNPVVVIRVRVIIVMTTETEVIGGEVAGVSISSCKVSALSKRDYCINS